MRLGTSGLGVIAVVSLLVTAAPERDDSEVNNEGSGFDGSRVNGSERTWRTRHPWPSQVATETTSSTSSSSFVKIEFESGGPKSPRASSHLSRPSLGHTDRTSEVPTALGRSTTDFPTSRLAQPRNFARVDVSPDVPLANGNPKTKLEDNDSHSEVDSSVSVSDPTARVPDEKLVVSVVSPLAGSIFSDSTFPSTILRRSRRRGKLETPAPDRRTEIQDNSDEKTSTTTWLGEATTENVDVSGANHSTGTMNRLLTATMKTSTKTTTQRTTTSMMARRSPLDENFRNATVSYKVNTARGTRESSRNKETTNANSGQTHFLNGQRENPAVLGLSDGTIPDDGNDDSHSESRYLTNYSVPVSPIAHIGEQNGGGDAEMLKNDGEPVGESLIDDRKIVKTDNRLPDEFVLIGKSLRKVDNSLRVDIRDRDDDADDEHRELTMKSMVAGSDRKPVTSFYTSSTEEIVRARQITSASTLEIPDIERPFSRSSVGMVANTSGADVASLMDNHRASRVRSFQTMKTEQQQQQQHQQRSLNSGSVLVPSRLPNDIVVKDTDDSGDAITATGFEGPAIRLNQFAITKTSSPVAKNLSKPSINLLDGKPMKKYYEIKPSLITEMDRETNVESTTTPKRIFDTFVLPSVPSAFGKFGPYFLDEKDRRNVTERIGNTVQLDCRIGLLGHRKVTWLQHYKDSFRLLTVERESYSVDRRISLNFQYPDNWRLQIAYASIRDSGLYKCQVEIDQDRSLVKRYNVIITAPTLTITDDSGRPVSGERHLKAGSALKLRCEARDVMQRLNESVLWMRGDETLTDDVSENRTTEIVNDNEITVVVSTLVVERAIPRHAGNYSCVVPEKARTTIAVHVLNGELPAAVQHGSGVSTAVLNLWLIHLTASYGFFR